MRIAITVDPLEPQLGGIGRYTLELVKRLARNPAIDDLRYFLHGRWIADPLALLHKREVPERGPSLVPRSWQGFLARRRYKSHLFHGTNFFLPADAERGVITVHDLSVIRFPELHPVERIRDYEQQFARSLDRTAHIITPSETIRKEVIEYLGVEPARVTAVALAASPDFRPRPVQELAAILKPWKLEPGNYCLSVSTIEPRKKLEQTIEAWANLPPAIQSKWPLVVAGGSGWKNDRIRERLRHAEEKGWVRNVGYFPEDCLPALYAGARLMLYPSTYEGFGLPALEALASGVPSIVSSVSCVAEITQGAALQVDPDDIDEFAGKIEQALIDEEWRSRAIPDGLRVAAGYSWNRCVSETISVYRQALA